MPKESDMTAEKAESDQHTTHGPTGNEHVDAHTIEHLEHDHPDDG